MCTLAKLFPHIVGNSKCDGIIQNLECLNVSAESFLADHDISSQGYKVTLADLIINKLSGEYIEAFKLGLVDVCEDHKIKLTRKHKSLKQKMCAVTECKGKGRLTKKRVSYGASLNIFNKTRQHVPAGSILCQSHRCI